MSLKDHIKNEIERAAREMGLSLRAYSMERSLEVRRELAQRFSTKPDKPSLLCDLYLKDYCAYYSADSWTLVDKLLACSPVLFFIDPDEDMTVWGTCLPGEFTRQDLAEIRVSQ